MSLSPSTKPDRRCSLCGEGLQTGYVEVKGTWLGFFLGGTSVKHLWFRADGADNSEIVLESSEWRRAYRCAKCSAVVIPGPDPTA